RRCIAANARSSRGTSLLALLQLDGAALALIELEVVGVRLLERVAHAAVADLPGGELIGHAPLAGAVRRYRLHAIARHAALAVAALAAAELDHPLVAAVDRPVARGGHDAIASAHRIALS